MRKYILLKPITFFLLLTMLTFASFEASAQSKKDRQKAQKIAKLGDDLFNQGKYQEAIEKYTEALNVFPNYPAAHFWKGYAHFYLNQWDDADKELSLALSQGYEKTLDIYQLRWRVNYQKQDYDAALDDVLAASRLDSGNASYNFAAGDIYRQKKNYQEAINYYKKGLQSDANYGDAYYFMAESYFFLGDYLNQGFAGLDALKKNTKYVGESYYYVGDALYKAKKYDEAIEYYERAINVKPDIYGSYIALSDIFRIKNRFTDAINTVKKGQQLYPQDPTLWINLSWYYSLANRHNDAILAAQSAIKLDSTQATAYTNLCRAYNDTKQYNLAIQACNSALRINPGDGESHLYLARAYEFLKQSENAVENYNKAIEGLVKFTQQRPDYSDGFYLLGNAYFALQKDEDAIAAYKKCLELAPNFARARFALGYTYLEGGKKDLAREQYNELKNIDAALAERLRLAIDGK